MVESSRVDYILPEHIQETQKKRCPRNVRKYGIGVGNRCIVFNATVYGEWFASHKVMPLTIFCYSRSRWIIMRLYSHSLTLCQKSTTKFQKSLDHRHCPIQLSVSDLWHQWRRIRGYHTFSLPRPTTIALDIPVHLLPARLHHIPLYSNLSNQARLRIQISVKPYNSQARLHRLQHSQEARTLVMQRPPIRCG